MIQWILGIDLWGRMGLTEPVYQDQNICAVSLKSSQVKFIAHCPSWYRKLYITEEINNWQLMKSKYNVQVSEMCTVTKVAESFVLVLFE